MQNTQTQTQIQPGHYDLDPQRSVIRFRTRHLFGLGPVRGTFALRSGAVSVTDPLDGSTVFAEVDAASFTTGNPQRDRTVLLPRHLNAAAYPVITFAAPDTDPAAGVVSGTLTVRGVARPVTLTVTAAEPAGTEITVAATMHVDRYDFGLTAMRGLAGRYLDLELAATFARRNGGPDHG